ncbi:hypothetical protein LAZ67_21002715 [Cordylochernes scorpioides]|uniref:Mos1 transposase HTH domain-containing protein n=1 Tax=Cordylochernes scorpioides TaxID=51811 RepID=A0ABY6LN47_9ARAC|nr:hypothetical protein LAZ67_21002715 [Cordylochernes scorpioides]
MCAQRVLVFVLCGLLVTVNTVQYTCPPENLVLPCTCDSEGINCKKVGDDQGLKTALDRIGGGSYRGFWVQNANLRVLRANMFQGYKIDNFYLEVNNITEVQHGTFTGSEDVVQGISIFGNKLTTFPFTDLKTMKNLMRINIGRNQITEIPDFAFSDHPRLSTIILAENQINSIGINAFQNLPMLQRLDLTKNALTVLGRYSLNINMHHPALQQYQTKQYLSFTRCFGSFSIFTYLKKMDQRTCIKFYMKNEIKCADAFRMLTVAYGEATLDRSNVYRWYRMFSEGREDVNDEERAGRPSTSTTDEKINEVKKMILANRRITVREVAEDLNISIGSCHSIFINDLGMRRVAAKFVPKLLNCDQKQHRMDIANEMLDSVRDDPNLLQRVITGDEAWVYGYDVETKAQSSQWKLPHEPRPKKARQVRSNVKVLLTVFFDCRGVAHHEFLPQGRTVNKEYYLQVMRNLREAIRQKRSDLWKNKNWLLHHNNAPAPKTTH